MLGNERLESLKCRGSALRARPWHPPPGGRGQDAAHRRLSGHVSNFSEGVSGGHELVEGPAKFFIQPQAALQINGSVVMLNDDFPEHTGGTSMTPAALGGTPVTIHLTVTDVDDKFQQAVDAGATVVVPLEDAFWGDRYGVLRDPFGHRWSMGQPVREVGQEEIAKAIQQS